MSMRTPWRASGLLAAALWCAASAAQAQTIKIGLPVPLSGPYGAEAQDQVRNAELAVKQFNDAGGLDGRKAQLLVRDDRLNPAEAATRALELIEKDGVNFIVGGLSAATQLSINNVTRQRRSCISPSASPTRSTRPPTPAHTLSMRRSIRT